jgi:glycosyltransferase involved in cell wall biosynthesis
MRPSSGPQARPLHLLTVAELHWRNGHEYALQAAQLLKQRGIDLEYRIVGQGPFLEAVGFARCELGLAEQVLLIPDAASAAEDLHFAWADVFVLAAVAGGAGHALDEALARRLPIVCTDVPALAAKIVEGPNGLIVPRRDPHALAACLVARLIPQLCVIHSD